MNTRAREILANWGPPLVLCAFGLAAAGWPYFTSGFALMEADPADSRHLNYVLEYGHRWLTGAAPSLWSPPFFYPQPLVGAYTELMLGVLPFYSAFRLLGVAPDTAFQLWTLSCLALTFLAGWLLFRRALSFEPLPAAVGAYLAAFSSARMAQLNHQHLLPHFLGLFAVHALVRLVSGGRRPRVWLSIFFLSLVLQLYASVYLGWFLSFALAVAVGWALALRETRARALELLRAHWLALTVGLAASALALWPLAGPYLAASRAVGTRTFLEAEGMVPQLQSWLYQGPHSLLGSWQASLSVFARLPMEGEHRLGLGVLTTALSVAVLWRERRRPWVRVLALTTLTVMLCATLYRGRVSPWAVVMAWVPGASALRAVARIGLLLSLPAGLALATLLQSARHRAVALAALAVCVLEQVQRVPGIYDKAGARADVERVVRAVPVGCHTFFYAPPGPGAYDEKTQLDAMWAGLTLGVPTVNGYSSNAPMGWELGAHTLSGPEDRARLQAALRRWEARSALPPESVCWVEAPLSAAPGPTP